MKLGDILADDVVLVNFGSLQFLKCMAYNVYGKEMSGKSAMLLFLANKLIKKGHNVLFFETENKLQGYEAIRSETYQENLKKMIIGDYPIFIKKSIGSKIVPDYSEFFIKLEAQILKDKINVLMIDSISNPLIEYHWKIASAIMTDFINSLKKIALDNKLLCIFVSHAKEDYDASLKKYILLPRGSFQSRYLVKRIMTSKNTAKQTNNFYSATFHNTSEIFDINDDGTIDEKRIGG